LLSFLVPFELFLFICRLKFWFPFSISWHLFRFVVSLQSDKSSPDALLA
jgi:hypothetical protein